MRRRFPGYFPLTGVDGAEVFAMEEEKLDLAPDGKSEIRARLKESGYVEYTGRIQSVQPAYRSEFVSFRVVLDVPGKEGGIPFVFGPPASLAQDLAALFDVALGECEEAVVGFEPLLGRSVLILARDVDGVEMAMALGSPDAERWCNPYIER